MRIPWTRLSRVFLGAVLLASLGCLHSVRSVSAGSLLGDSLLCEGNHSTSYQPALTNTSQPITVTTHETYGLASPNVGACVVVGAPITGGTRSSQVTVLLSCTQLLANEPATFTYLWNTGATSTVHWSTLEVNRLASETEIIRAGNVIGGFGSGDTATGTTTFLNADLAACFTTGVSSLSGPATLSFTPL